MVRFLKSGSPFSSEVVVHWHGLVRGQELCESGGGRPGLLVPNSPYGLCGRKATLNFNRSCHSCVNTEVGLGSHSLSHSLPCP